MRGTGRRLYLTTLLATATDDEQTLRWIRETSLTPDLAAPYCTYYS